MLDEELRKIDYEQLLAEREVLKELLKENPYGSRAKYWREELARINEIIARISPTKSSPDHLLTTI